MKLFGKDKGVLKEDHFLEKIFLAVSMVVFLVMTLLSSGWMGGGDTFAHFLISKYSWNHHELFFDHWGKPVFTILTSPFSQFGIVGLTAFNILCGLLSSVLTFKIVKTLKNSTLPVFALLLTPFFASIHISGLTEPLFTVFLCLFVLFALDHRFVLMSIVVGLIPFIRTEGVLVVFVAVSLLITLRRFKEGLLIFLPAIVISLIGSIFHQGDILWLINKLPYAVQSFYEEGSVLHFIRKSDIIFGIPLIIFGLSGAYFFFSRRYKAQWIKTLILFFLPLVYFLFHSILYGFGLGASAGLKRVMIVLTPFLVIWSSYTFSYLNTIDLRLSKAIKCVFVIMVVAQLASSSRLPVRKSKEQKAIISAVNEINSMETGKETIFYFHPIVPVLKDCDPFDKIRCVERLSDKRQLVPGDFILWDNHFGKGEGQTPLDLILDIEGIHRIYEVEEGGFRVVVFRFMGFQ